MKIKLEEDKIVLDESTKRNVPGGLLVITDILDPFYLDVLVDKLTYTFPKGITKNNVVSIYLRLM